jgi:hypothetical protein
LTDDSPFVSKKPEANCFAAILMGLKCGQNPNIKPVEMAAPEQPETVDPVGLEETISTAKTGLVPDRDEFDAKPMTVSTGDPIKLAPNSFQVWSNVLKFSEAEFSVRCQGHLQLVSSFSPTCV